MFKILLHNKMSHSNSIGASHLRPFSLFIELTVDYDIYNHSPTINSGANQFSLSLEFTVDYNNM